MGERQRLDKWLWFARVVKTRTLAAKLVSDGYVRLNGQRIDVPAHAVAPGDVLTISLERQVRVLRVVGPGLRREAYPLAKLLFEEMLSPENPGV
jgi:ribosome-associated heat shock protein Hsp15